MKPIFKTVLQAATVSAALSCIPSLHAQTTQTPAGSATAQDRSILIVQEKIEPFKEFDLILGVRSQAAPFSYLSNDQGQVFNDRTPGVLRKLDYTGYIIKVCDAVLDELLTRQDIPDKLKPTTVGIFDIDKYVSEVAQADAAQRKQAEENGRDHITIRPQKRFDLLGEQYDILCDPATITNNRREGVFVSPPLFVTGIALLAQSKSSSPIDPCVTHSGKDGKYLIGMVGGTTANTIGLSEVVRKRLVPQYNDVLLNVLRNPRSGVCKTKATDASLTTAEKDALSAAERQEFEKRKAAENTRTIVHSYENHEDAAHAFCSGKTHYYMGDAEIIRWYTRNHIGCNPNGGTQTFTNDRYAVFGKVDWNDTERALRVAKFFEILSQRTVFSPSLVDKAFEETFLSDRPSRKLKTFYWALRGEKFGP